MIDFSFGPNETYLPPPMHYRVIKEPFYAPLIHDHVVYDDASHTYKYDGVQMSTSISRLVAAAVGDGEFDSKVRAEGVFYKCQMFKQLSSAKKHEASLEDRKRFGRYGHFTSSQDIELEWVRAREFGKAVHLAIQNYYNGKPVDPVIQETKQFKAFRKFDADFSKLYEPVASELTMALPSIDAGGTIDMLYRSIKVDGVYIIVDWKTTLEDDYGKDKKCNRPFDHLPATKKTKAVLQTNFYAEMFERLVCDKNGHPVKNTVCLVVYLRENAEQYETLTVERDPAAGLFFAERQLEIADLKRWQPVLFPQLTRQQTLVMHSKSNELVERGKHAELSLKNLFKNVAELLKTRQDSAATLAEHMCDAVERVISSSASNVIAIERGDALPFPEMAGENTYETVEQVLKRKRTQEAMLGPRSRYHEKFVQPPPPPRGFPGSHEAEEVDDSSNNNDDDDIVD
jgi:hypothetical protein